MRNKDLSLYIHIPFCVRKCAYCDFLSFAAEDGLKARYIDRLCTELKEEAKDHEDRTVISVFFGGGTPSVLPPEQFERVMGAVCDNYRLSGDTEISIEVNPGTVDIDKLKIYRKSGVNRLSIGCQSLDDKELEVLGRIHRRGDFYRTFENARDAGFDNINVDLMSALPGQSVAGYEQNLKKVLSLKPEHISAYSLIIEEGTPFFEIYKKDMELRDKGDKPVSLPDEDEEREMLYLGRKLLDAAGYKQYEISNYALPGRECRHNTVYWRRGDYAGFGLGAASCVDELRWKNTEDIKEYIASEERIPKLEVRKLTIEEQRSEAMFLGLRMTRGIDLGLYTERYGENPLKLYGEWIGRMIGEGLVDKDQSRLWLTLKGQDLANYVWGGFI